MHIAANQHLAMTKPSGNRVIGSAIANQRQRVDPPWSLVAGVVGRCGKVSKNRAIARQALADRLLMATQPFRPSLAAARFEMRVQLVEGREPWHRHQEVPTAIADQAFHFAFIVPLAGAAKPVLEQIMGS